MPTAVADLHEGETVLDLGSGAGADVLISARRVGPTGKAIGIDMTDEMLDLARANAGEGGRGQRRVHQGLPRRPPAPRRVASTSSSPTASSTSPPTRRSSCARRRACCDPADGFAVSDVIADPDLDDATRADVAAWTGCIAGALTEPEFHAALESAGFDEIEIRPTHAVHEHAAAAIVRARKPPV